MNEEQFTPPVAREKLNDPLPGWLAGGGEMGQAVREFDWASTPLGPLASWPDSLRTTVSICLNSRFPMFIWWGPGLINLHNDAYRPILGKRATGALGQSARDLWRDAWRLVAPQVASVMERGQPSYSDRVQVITDRNGYEETAYFTYSHSPVFDDSGRVGGLLCVVSEETQKVLAEKRQSFLFQIIDTLRHITDPTEIVSSAVTALGKHLGASRVGYGYVQPDDETIDLETSYVDGVEPLNGRFPLSSFGPENILRQREGVTVVHDDVAADPSNNPATWAAIDTRSFVSVPLVRNGRFRASLYVNQREPRLWSPEELSLIEDVAGRIWDAVERASADEARRQSDERLTFELEAAGGVGTWDYDVPEDRLYCNAQFARLFSVDPESAAAGAPLAQFMPSIHEDDRASAEERVTTAIATGGNYLAEYRVVPGDGSVRWLHARGSGRLDRSGKPSRFTGVVFDITERKFVALRDAFLVRLDDEMRSLTDPQEITETAARLVAEHLGVHRCAYADVATDEDTFHQAGVYNRGTPRVIGRYAFSEFGDECLRLMRHGQPYVVNDAEADPRTEAVREAFRIRLIGSTICVPIRKMDRLVAAMAVHQTSPREWRPDEVELLQLVANRCWDAIERTRAERDLRDSQERLRAIFHGTYEYIGLLTPEGVVLEANRAALGFGDFSLEDIVGRPFWETPWWTNTPGAAAAVRQGIARAASGEFVRYEAPLARPSGEVITFDFSLHPILNDRGDVIFIVPEGRNINDRKAAEAALTANEARYRTLFESIDEGYCIIEVLFDASDKAYDYRFVEANPAFARHTGLVDAVGRRIRDMVQNHDELWFEAYGSVAITGEPMRFIDHSESLHRWFDVYAFRIGDPEQREIAVLLKDISAQKKAEVEREGLLQQIEAERQRLQQVFSEAPVAIAVFRGPEFLIELANPSYSSLLEGRDLVGRRFAEAVPEIGPDVMEVLRRVRETGEPYAREDFYIPYDRDGDGVVEDHWFNVLYHPLRETDGTVSGIVIVCTEVTTQLIARKDLERANRELEEFAYVASHDLQEPLRMVNIYSQLLLRKMPAGDEEAHLYAGYIRQGVKRMEELIRDLLSYSRAIHRDGPQTGVADLSVSLTRALVSVDTRLKETGGKVTAGVLPVVRGDTIQFAHVFQNLLSNSLKYWREGVAPEISISADKDGSDWIISVRDNGIGFEQKYAERIFGLFKRLHKDEYSGTGLGLAICQRIVERYGGRMWASGRPGQGATFYFSIPEAEVQ